MTKMPPYLVKGNCIGITCPAGYMDKSKAAACIQTLQQWGFEVMVGKTLGSNSKNYFSGTDADRADELQAMLDDENIHAILFGRGGYGMGRIIDRLNFKKFLKNPKWLIGFSDITILHTHIFSHFSIATIHGPMAGAFNKATENPFYVNTLHKMITGKKNTYSIRSAAYNRKGTATGKLIGGNLSLLVNVIGTKSDFDTKNKILFIEEIGELLYATDRMLYQLKRSDKLKNLSGLIIGGFTEMRDTERPFGKSIEEIIKDLIEEYDYPVCFNFPVSHEMENVALKLGARYELKTGKTTSTLKEI